MVRKWHADGGDYAFRFNYDLSDQSIVLDLGGYEGQWASDLFARYQCPIFIFEPVAAFANRIRDRFAKNKTIQVHQYGLGDVSRSEEISIAGDGSSVFGKSRNKETIEIVDVTEWIESNLSTDQSIDLMKINVEGCEYEILDRLIKTHLVNRIKNIQVQFHQVMPDSAARMERIQSQLIKTHTPTYQYTFVWENWKHKNIH